jgi:phage terminase large subunit
MQLPGFTVTDVDIKHTNGSYIAFRGMKDHTSDSVKSMEGFDIAWIEEAQMLRQRSFDVLYPTIRAPGSELWFSWNPRYAEDPVDKFFTVNANDPDVISIIANWRDNPWISAELVKDKDRDMANDPVAAMHIWEGEYLQASQGAYYAKDIVLAYTEGRVRTVPHDRSVNTYAAFDLGIGDSTALWVFQLVGMEWHWLKYYEGSGKALGHYIDVLLDLPYKINTTLLPHDAEARELQTGKSRREYFEERGFRTQIVRRSAVEDGIEAVRQVLNRCYFDINDTAAGLHMLRSYRTDYSENLRTYSPRPLHDFASHGADAFRTAVMGLPPVHKSDWSKPIIRNLKVVA